MRDPARIDVVLDAIRAYWKARPDLRLCQILGNASDGEVSSEFYNTEDDELLNGIGAFVEEHAVDCDYVRRGDWCDCPRRAP